MASKYHRARGYFGNFDWPDTPWTQDPVENEVITSISDGYK